MKRKPIHCHYCKRDFSQFADLVRRYSLHPYEVCDDHDNPMGVFRVVCDVCAYRLDDSQTLYIRRYMTSGDICPGAMPQCNACPHRRAVKGNYKCAAKPVFAPAPSGDINWMPNKLGLNSRTPSDWPNCLKRAGVHAVQEPA